jgi:hypothetical protein
VGALHTSTAATVRRVSHRDIDCATPGGCDPRHGGRRWRDRAAAGGCRWLAQRVGQLRANNHRYLRPGSQGTPLRGSLCCASLSRTYAVPYLVRSAQNPQPSTMALAPIPRLRVPASARTHFVDGRLKSKLTALWCGAQHCALGALSLILRSLMGSQSFLANTWPRDPTQTGGENGCMGASKPVARSLPFAASDRLTPSEVGSHPLRSLSVSCCGAETWSGTFQAHDEDSGSAVW